MTQYQTDTTEEVNKFNSLAQYWWDPNGPLQPLHGLNPIRLAFIQNTVNLANKNVLDIGCGGGILTESLAKAGAFATGIDLAQEVLMVATEHAKTHHLNIHYHCISASDFAAENPGQFDVITCMEMLEHVPDPREIIQACAQLLKPGGQLFLSTLNRNLKSFLVAIIGAEYITNMIPKGTHEYAKFMTPAELSRMLRDANFEVNQMKGMRYQLLRKEFKLTDNCDVNYLLNATLI